MYGTSRPTCRVRCRSHCSPLSRLCGGGNAQQTGGTAQRLLAVPEMILYYLALVGCVLAAVRSHARDRAILAALVSFCLVFVLAYALVITNIGTLYRMRYPAMLLLCALGIWGWSIVFRRNVSYDRA